MRLRRHRKDRTISVPPGTVVPEGFVLVTSRSWHGTQLALRGLLVGVVLSAASWFVVQLQLQSRNDNIATTQQTTERLEAQVAKLSVVAGKAQLAAEAGTAALQAAIAQSGGGEGNDLATRSAIAVEQIDAVCRQVVSDRACDVIAAAVRQRLADQLAAQQTTTTTTRPGG